MVRQVFVSEKVMTGENQIRVRPQLAFGSHPDIAMEDDDRMVSAAVANTNQEMRIVFDELLVGARLEEIACADGSYSTIPDDATPTDIDNCAGPLDAILEKGCDSVCIGPNGPVGILDEVPTGGGDGAPDDFRLREYDDGSLPVTITCDGAEMPIDRELSFWNPSGNQLIPAGPLGHRGLGPALVVVPQQGLRTGSSCEVSFHPQVIDKDGNQPCTPPGGDITQDCTPGDTAGITFQVEPLVLTLADPPDGAENVGLNADILLQFNAGIDAASLGGVTLETAGGAAVGITPMVQGDDPSLIIAEIDGGLAPDTDYVLTIPTTVTDVFGGALPSEVVIMFSTGVSNMPEPDADTSDAGMADAA